MTRINKVTLRNIGLDKPDLKEAARSDFPGVARMLGRATSMEQDSSTFGHFYKFEGFFTGINLQTGEEFVGHICILPALAEQELVEAVEAASQAADGNAFEVEFGFDISVIPNNKPDTVGYEFIVQPLINEKKNPLAGLMKALPAPKIRPKQIAEKATA